MEGRGKARSAALAFRSLRSKEGRLVGRARISRSAAVGGGKGSYTGHLPRPLHQGRYQPPLEGKRSKDHVAPASLTVKLILTTLQRTRHPDHAHVPLPPASDGQVFPHTLAIRRKKPGLTDRVKLCSGKFLLFHGTDADHSEEERIPSEEVLCRPTEMCGWDSAKPRLALRSHTINPWKAPRPALSAGKKLCAKCQRAISRPVSAPGFRGQQQPFHNRAAGGLPPARTNLGLPGGAQWQCGLAGNPCPAV